MWILRIPNPVNPGENFADRWNENSALPVSFFKWLGQLRKDFDTAVSQSRLEDMGKTLKVSFGENIIDQSMERYGGSVKPTKVYPEVKLSTKPDKPWMMSKYKV